MGNAHISGLCPTLQEEAQEWVWGEGGDHGSRLGLRIQEATGSTRLAPERWGGSMGLVTLGQRGEGLELSLTGASNGLSGPFASPHTVSSRVT